MQHGSPFTTPAHGCPSFAQRSRGTGSEDAKALAAQSAKVKITVRMKCISRRVVGYLGER